MDGYYIEARPLTPETAAEILRLLQTIQISAASCEQFLTLRGALDRVISGDDVVIANKAPE